MTDLQIACKDLARKTLDRIPSLKVSGEIFAEDCKAIKNMTLEDQKQYLRKYYPLAWERMMKNLGIL